MCTYGCKLSMLWGFDVVLCRKSASCELIPLLLSCLFLRHDLGSTFVFATVHTVFPQPVNAFIKVDGSKTVRVFFFLLARFFRDMKHRISMHILFILKIKTLVLIKWSYRCPHLCWLFEFRMIILFSGRIPTFCKHVSFWYLFLGSHQATYHFNIGVRLRAVKWLGTSTVLTS